MHSATGTAILWTTLFSLFLIAAIATLVGRPFSLFFPARLQPRVKFYLAPTFGLAAIQLFIAVLGRYVPLGNSVFPVLALALVVAASMAAEALPREALAQAGLTGLYAVCTSGAMLVPLLLFGGYNSSNDAFTYLAQSDWLQLHAFHETIPADKVTAPLTQIALYQQLGFRMGGTYLLGFFQALLNVRWSYDIYPAVIFAPVGALCLACGFPLARLLIRYPRRARLAILSVPAYSLGGVVFAAWYGFLPQSYGELFSIAALFIYGALIGFVGNPAEPLKRRMLPAVPLGMLVAASVFSYSELSPFLVLALLLATVLFAIRNGSLGAYILFGALTTLVAALLLNIEIIRSVQALLVQKGAVVGNAVDWPLITYLAHALGIHGGSWDLGQWAGRPVRWSNVGVLAGMLAVLLLAALVPLNARRLKAQLLNGALLPAVAMLGILVAAFGYFRYVVASPFPAGTGQSWSQFKLADWAHPLVLTLLAFALVPRFAQTPKSRAVAVAAAGVIALSGLGASAQRIASVRHEFPDVHDLENYYLTVRRSVVRTCPASSPIYLDLGDRNRKLRQMLALFLADRKLKSDWSDDGYIANNIARSFLQEQPERGDCFIQTVADHPHEAGLTEGKLRIGTYRRNTMVITRIDNIYPTEAGADGWWMWVRHNATFHVGLIDPPVSEFRFSIGLNTPQTITVGVIDVKRRKQTTTLKLQPGSHDLAVPFDGIVTQVEMASDNAKPQLRSGYDRGVDFVVRNFRIAPRSEASK
jgi:hypothetical protein